MIEEDIYTYRLWPWLSKSTIISDDFCEWLFYLRYIKRIDVPVGLSAKTGTNMHATVAKFFEVIDIQQLTKIPINYEELLEESRIYNFIKKTVFEIIPVDSREYTSYKTILTNFALMEADHWISLNEQFKGNISKVLKYFMPASVEKFIQIPYVSIYGTLDRRTWFYTPDRDINEIYDYKTGHTPKDVKRGLKDVGNEFSWTLPTNKMFELHFYVILDMHRRGLKIHPELVDYITKEDNFYDKAPVPVVNSHFVDSNGDPHDFTKDYHVGIIYLGDKLGPFVPKKKANKRSMSAAFRRINHLRGKVYRNHAWQKMVNYWKCKNCSITEQCLNEIEMSEMGLEPKEIV